MIKMRTRSDENIWFLPSAILVYGMASIFGHSTCEKKYKKLDILRH
jgi:hypothetical protein